MRSKVPEKAATPLAAELLPLAAEEEDADADAPDSSVAAWTLGADSDSGKGKILRRKLR